MLDLFATIPCVFGDLNMIFWQLLSIISDILEMLEKKPTTLHACFIECKLIAHELRPLFLPILRLDLGRLLLALLVGALLVPRLRSCELFQEQICQRVICV